MSYTLDAVEYAGTLIYDDAKPATRALLLIPNWMGINAANLAQARLVAERGYTVYVVDMYGKSVRPTTMQEAAPPPAVSSRTRRRCVPASTPRATHC